jgi:hypothetical protein
LQISFFFDAKAPKLFRSVFTTLQIRENQDTHKSRFFSFILCETFYENANELFQSDETIDKNSFVAEYTSAVENILQASQSSDISDAIEAENKKDCPNGLSGAKEKDKSLTESSSKSNSDEADSSCTSRRLKLPSV